MGWRCGTHSGINSLDGFEIRLKDSMNKNKWFKSGSILIAIALGSLIGFFLYTPVFSSISGSLPVDLSEEVKPGVFLVAGNGLRDPNFRESVVLLVQHDGTGTMGVIINRPTNIPLSEALPEVHGLKGTTDPLFIGGPVGFNQLFTLIQSDKLRDEKDVIRLLDDVYFNASLPILEDLLRQTDSSLSFRGYVGHAGWVPGQLDMELKSGSWLVKKADAFTIFEKDAEQIWPELIIKRQQLWVLLSPGLPHFPG